MAENLKVKGPASSFPSFEKTYGHPADYWFKLLSTQKIFKHMEMTAWLKTGQR
tara:strand:- start:7119 stop:7277 length:159 start_codon:yes stop_codon:yes gene_type:complete